MSTTSTRTGLLAMAVMFSAGIHAALAPEHLQEMPPLGYLFIAAAAGGAVIACALVTRGDDIRIQLLAVLFLVGQVLAWALFVTVHVPPGGFVATLLTVKLPFDNMTSSTVTLRASDGPWLSMNTVQSIGVPA